MTDALHPTPAATPDPSTLDPQIAELLKLWQNRRRASGQVKRIAETHIADLDRRMAEMQAMRRALAELAHCCHGDDRPDCPILDDLAQGATP